LNNRFC